MRGCDIMKIPQSAADGKHVIGQDDAIVLNPYFGKELLTITEALDCIAHIAEILRVNEYCGSKE